VGLEARARSIETYILPLTHAHSQLAYLESFVVLQARIDGDSRPCESRDVFVPSYGVRECAERTAAALPIVERNKNHYGLAFLGYSCKGINGQHRSQTVARKNRMTMMKMQ